MQPTPRGTVRLKTWNAKDMPLRPEADRHNTREGLSKVQQVFLDTAAGQQIIVEETMTKDFDAFEFYFHRR